MERFTRAFADLAGDSHPNIGAVLKIVERHGLEMLGPIASPAHGSSELSA